MLPFRRVAPVVLLLVACAPPGLADRGGGSKAAGDALSSPENASAIDAYVDGLSLVQGKDPSVVKSATTPPQQDGGLSCTTSNFAETRQYDKIVSYDVNSDTLWPGALLHGNSVQDGVFTPAVLDRAPLTVSLSLENLQGAKSAAMKAPSLSGYRDALGQVLAAGMNGATPASISSEIEEVKSENELSLALGASVSFGGFISSVSGSFNFKNKDVRSHQLVKFTQAYYTVDVDPPGAPSAMFAPAVTVDAVKAKFPSGDPPAYVASVTYGRIVVFTIESSYSSEETAAALKAAFIGYGSGSVSTKDTEVLSNSTITAFIVGGSGADAAKSISGYDALKAFIGAGGNYSKDSPGAPIAYKLRYLRDDTPLKMSLTQDFTATECDKIGSAVHVTLKSIKVVSSDGDGSLQIYGSVVVTSQGQKFSLFDKNGDNYVEVADGNLFPTTGSVADLKIPVTSTPGSTFAIDADLTDHNKIFSDDHIGKSHNDFAIEDGWHKTITIRLTDSQKDVELEIDLEPI